MSNSDIRVVPGPANYFSHPGSLERLSDFSAPTSSRERCGSMASAPGRRRNFLPAAFHLPEAKRSALPATAANATWRGWCRPPVTIAR
nr:putative oxidoreductase [Klebsiella pneumoniae]